LKSNRLIFPFVAALLALRSFVSAAEQAGKVRRAETARPVHSVPSPQESAYEKAFELLKKGKASEALVEINSALAKDPSNTSLYNLRGLAEGQLGRKKEAEISFRQVTRLAPDASLGYVNLGVLLSQSGRVAEAVDLFRAALQRDPHNFTALLGLGAAVSSLGRYREAEPYLEEAWKKNPGDFQAGYEYAQTLREMNQPAEAQKILDRIAPPQEALVAAKFFTLSGVLAEDRKDWAAAAHFYSRAYQLSPNSFDIYVSLVRVDLAGDGTQKGRGLPPPPAHLFAEQHFALGLLFASRGAYAQAIPRFEETLRMEPDSYSAAFNLALSYKGGGKNQEAINLCESTIKKKPTAELYSLLGSLDEDTGLYLEAVRNFRRAVELEPTHEQYYFDLGAEYLAHFTFGPALEVFRVGSQKFPGAAREHLGLGLAHYALRHYVQAAEAFLNALEIDPSSANAYTAWNSLTPSLAPEEWERFLPRLRGIAELHARSAEALYFYGVTLFRHGLALGNPGDFDLAQSLLERALRLKPNFSDAHLELGNLHVARNENEKAVAEFLETLRLNPRSEMAHYRLGQTYRNLNQLESAQAELARYAELSHSRRELMARSRSAIKQFILAETSTSAPREAKPPEQRPP